MVTVSRVLQSFGNIRNTAVRLNTRAQAKCLRYGFLLRYDSDGEGVDADITSVPHNSLWLSVCRTCVGKALLSKILVLTIAKALFCTRRRPL